MKMTEERILSIREIVKVYLEANRWSIADMAFLIGIPRSTLSEWISGKRDLTERNMCRVKAFLNGDYAFYWCAVRRWCYCTARKDGESYVETDWTKQNTQVV